MASIRSQIEEIEAGLIRLQGEIPALPVTQILTTRLLVHLGRELSSLMDQRLRLHGLNEMEFRALIQIYSYRKSAAYPGNLCANLAQSPANVTRLTDSLVERGLIIRIADAADRRRLILKTTPQGEQLIELLMPLMMDSTTQNFRDFSAEKLQQLLNSLKHLALAIDNASERASAAAQAE